MKTLFQKMRWIGSIMYKIEYHKKALKEIQTLKQSKLDKKVKQLDRFVVLTNEDANNWKNLTNLTVIPNPITIQYNLCSHLYIN